MTTSAGEQPPGDHPAAAPAGPPRDRAAQTSALLRDLGLVLAWSVVAGIVVGLVWWKLVDLPQAVRDGGSVVVQADQLGKQVNIDGWFFVLALVAGLISGIVLLFWRERDPLLMVVLVTLGGGLSSLLADKLGGWLGPGSAQDALRHRDDGAHAPMPLHLHAPGVLWVWPAAAALGALVFLWVLRSPESEESVPQPAQEPAH